MKNASPGTWSRITRRWANFCPRPLFLAPIFLLALLFVQPTLGWAVTLDDVIKLSRAGNSDEMIIKAIEATPTPFHLGASDIITLKEEGVSDAVILALVNTDGTGSSTSDVPIGSSGGSKEPAGAHGSGEQHEAHATNESPSAPRLSENPNQLSDRAGPESKRYGEPFSYYPFHEDGAGHGGSHDHYALAMRGTSVLILRSEAGRHSIKDRAREVSTRLNRLLEDSPFGYFFSSSKSVWYQATSSAKPVLILNVDRGDVIAYQRRSLGQVSSDRLAAYWAAILSDYTGLFVLGRPPNELVNLHLGEVLSKIYDELTSPTGSEGEADLDETRAVLKVLDHLESEDKEHLLELATRIPAEFVGAEVSK